ncbi:hypothetical protein MARINOS108_50026 [Marinoscillum sp. 108]|nr:hypothetical protein MARINOS108_50026 [Marinoscillum sp. 108]
MKVGMIIDIVGLSGTAISPFPEVLSLTNKIKANDEKRN